MTLKGDAKFKGKLTCNLKNDLKNLVEFNVSSRESGNLYFDGLLLSKAYKDLDEKVQNSCVSWQWSVKFEEKIALSSKNDLRNLVNFNASSGKSENFHFDVLHLSIEYKVSAKKTQKNYLSWHWKRSKIWKKKLTFCLKNDMKSLVNFNPSSGKFENFHFDGLLLKKACNVWAKKNAEELCREK